MLLFQVSLTQEGEGTGVGAGSPSPARLLLGHRYVTTGGATWLSSQSPSHAARNQT